MAIIVSVLSTSCDKQDVYSNPKTDKITLESDEFLSTIPENEIWSTQDQKCITYTDVCCVKPKPIIIVKDTIIVTMFYDALSNETIGDFFSNYDYSAIWPQFNQRPDVVQGLINGSLRIVQITNAATNINYFLVGDTSNTNQQITSNPTFTFYLD